MPIMPTLRFQRNISLRMWQPHQTRPGNYTTYPSQFLTLSKHPTSVRLWLLQGVTNTSLTHDRNNHKAKDAQRDTKKGGRNFTSIRDRGQNDETHRESHLAIGWSDAWVRYLDHIAQIDTFHKAPQEQRNRYNHLIYLRSVDEERQAPRLPTRPGYQEAKTALFEMQRQSRQDLGITFITKSERRRLNDQLNPSLRGYLEWLSINWAEYFT